MKKLITIMLFIPFICNGQGTFFRSYGGSGNDFGEAVLLTSDSCYLVVGATESFGNGVTDLYVFKVELLQEALRGSNLRRNPLTVRLFLSCCEFSKRFRKNFVIKICFSLNQMEKSNLNEGPFSFTIFPWKFSSPARRSRPVDVADGGKHRHQQSLPG